MNVMNGKDHEGVDCGTFSSTNWAFAGDTEENRRAGNPVEIQSEYLLNADPECYQANSKVQGLSWKLDSHSAVR
jgi:hypothetical protein